MPWFTVTPIERSKKRRIRRHGSEDVVQGLWFKGVGEKTWLRDGVVVSIGHGVHIRKPKRKDAQVPQSSDPTKNVTDEAVHKELGDSLVRAATTASSLKVEQDSGNINKTQSKATPNEFSSIGTNSGGGPWVIHTARSDEDSLKLNELMELGTTLQQRVLDLEKTKTTQHNEIASLKMRVKKLEKKGRSRTHRLKRLYKVGFTARLESSGNKESLGEDASKQKRIDAIDADEEITLVSVQNVDDEVVNTAKLLIDAAQVNAAITVNAATTITATSKTVDDFTLAQALMEIKSTKPKEKGVVIQELGESTTIISSQQSGREILTEPVKPMKKKDQIRLDEEAALKLQAEFDEEERLTREKAEKKMQAQEQEELSIEENATLFQQLLEKKRKHFAAKRAEEKRNKPPTKAQTRTDKKNLEQRLVEGKEKNVSKNRADTRDCKRAKAEKMTKK
ncbi:hypothetical protein Tco_1182500 [Tanacetum coccineum]